MEAKEDQTAPISRKAVIEAIEANELELKQQVARKITSSFNEKRDSYNGVVTSIIYVIDSRDAEMIQYLRDSLLKLFVGEPMKFGARTFMTKALSRLTSERPQFIEDLFEQLIEMTEDWSGSVSDKYEVLHRQVMAIKAIKAAESSKGGRPTKLSQSEIDRLCTDAIHSCDSATKIDTLSLILESRSTTKPIEQRELDLFKALFQDALSLQQPALRQVFLAQTNKLIKRIKDSLKVVIRDKKQFSDDDRSQVVNRYQTFLDWLTKFCFDSIYCNAYFGSFILTMTTLKYVIDHITFTDESLSIEHSFSTRRCYDSLLSCLNDSFEENKSMALNLLFLLPSNSQFLSKENLKLFEDVAYRLVESVNPAHSLTCQFVFKMVIGLKLKIDPTTTKNILLLKYLGDLTDKVEQGVIDTESSFVSALKEKPIYPKLTCIRALLTEVDIDDLEQNRNQWKHLSRRIISSSIEACRAVSKVVCNLNPETIGHVPMDLKPLDTNSLSKLLNTSLSLEDGKVCTITSQMLLICGWKTIKECSLSMGLMCTRLWWPRERIKMKKEKFPGLKTAAILDDRDLIMIVDFFDHYLKNLRHRGAFEQAYNGFMMVARRVWHEKKFRDILVGTLTSILNDFRSDALDEKKVQSLKAYVTRRSAGLPFIVAAILSSEHKAESTILNSVMKCLFEVLESEHSEEYQRVHCLNILKAVINDHNLGEKVLPFIGATFRIVLESFASKSFPIRNCASMLFKATIDRTFGINRLRHEIHRRNQVSFDKFFTECPGLLEQMIGYLRLSLVDARYLAAVHAVFIILFRLRMCPNSNKLGSVEAKQILEIMDLIGRLSFICPNMKLRHLACRQYSRLQTFLKDFIPEEQNSEVDNLRARIISDMRNSSHLDSSMSTLLKYEVEDNPSELSREKFRNHFISTLREKSDNFVKFVAIDAAQQLAPRHPVVDDKLLFSINHLEAQPGKPYYEALILKYTIFNIMSCCSTRIDISDDTNRSESLQTSLDRCLKFIFTSFNDQSESRISKNSQASLLRFLRHVIIKPGGYLDILLGKLDLDATAAHTSPHERLLLLENQLDEEVLSKYCNQEPLRRYILDNFDAGLFHFLKYEEFKPTCQLGGTKAFSSSFSNTARSIELLALAFVVWDKFNLKDSCIWMKEGENISDKLRFVTCFVSSLPDCDVKVPALLCAAKLILASIDVLSFNRTSHEEVLIIKRSLEQFSQVIDELSDGDHSLTVRETCIEVLRIILRPLLNLNHGYLKRCSVNFISSLIKLSQDEDIEVRSLSQRVILKLANPSGPRDMEVGQGNVQLTFPAESRLDNLIHFIVEQLFNPEIEQDICDCFELLARIVFDHSKNYSNDINAEKEHLFDKTKLNTFADHIAIVQSALNGLQQFLNRRKTERKIDLNTLRFSDDIIDELDKINQPSLEIAGDYSWRRKKMVTVGDSSSNSFVSEAAHTYASNNDIVDQSLVNLKESLAYFENGYSHMLVDTDYTYHEMSLFKRVSFLSCIISNTRNGLKNFSLIADIHKSLERIVNDSCSTTLVFKCFETVTGLIEQ